MPKKDNATMTRKFTIPALFCILALFGTAAALSAQQTVSYADAVTRTAVRLEDKLAGNAPDAGPTVAIIRFESASPRFSSRITDDLAEAFINGGTKVVDRKHLEDVLREQNFIFSFWESETKKPGLVLSSPVQQVPHRK